MKAIKGFWWLKVASLKELLKELSGLHGPTGYEEEVAAFMEKGFKKHGFTVKRDVLGNVIAKKGRGKKVLVAAHMDEISMAVSAITKHGFAKFVKVGGIYDGTLGNSRVLLHADKKLPGIVGVKAPHLMKEEELKKLQESDSMFVDFGARDKKDAFARGVRPGTLISFHSDFVELANDCVSGKAFDDRVGCAVLLKLAEEIRNPNCELYLVGTVREETGLLGAGPIAYGIEPDLAVAVDVTLAGGSPDVSDEEVPVELGNGPTLNVIESAGRGLMMSRELVKWIEGVAKKNKIAYQIEVTKRGATDASRMQYVKTGFLTASIGIPSRYIHSQTEMISVKDLEATKELTKAVVQEFKSYK